jgi:hypothetical protein
LSGLPQSWLTVTIAATIAAMTARIAVKTVGLGSSDRQRLKRAPEPTETT